MREYCAEVCSGNVQEEIVSGDRLMSGRDYCPGVCSGISGGNIRGGMAGGIVERNVRLRENAGEGKSGSRCRITRIYVQRL